MQRNTTKLIINGNLISSEFINPCLNKLKEINQNCFNEVNVLLAQLDLTSNELDLETLTTLNREKVIVTRQLRNILLQNPLCFEISNNDLLKKELSIFLNTFYYEIALQQYFKTTNKQTYWKQIKPSISEDYIHIKKFNIDNANFVFTVLPNSKILKKIKCDINIEITLVHQTCINKNDWIYLPLGIKNYFHLKKYCNKIEKGTSAYLLGKHLYETQKEDLENKNNINDINDTKNLLDSEIINSLTKKDFISPQSLRGIVRNLYKEQKASVIEIMKKNNIKKDQNGYYITKYKNFTISIIN